MRIFVDKYSALKEYFGYDSFKTGQEEVIDSILSGRDALCIMPTGAGKSICYQIPAVLLPGITLVISPLISLMRDQVTALSEAGIRAAYINSSLTAAQYHTVMERLVMGWYKIVFVAPERLKSESFSAAVSVMDVSFIAVDEAHCISQWGQDFRPSYLGISEFAASFPSRPVIGAFTATATDRVSGDIERYLGLNDPFRLKTGFDRPNLSFSVLRPENKEAEILKILRERRGKSGIIYCTTRKAVEELCDTLVARGIDATRYHAGLDDIERQTNQEQFIFDKKRVMVATNAFGMGIDKSNVSFVIHYQMPENIESYYQEAGRAGRDGTNAECFLLYDPRDVRICRFLIDNSTPNPELDADTQEELHRRALYRLGQMTRYCKTDECLRAYILRYFGEKTASYCGNCSNCEDGSLSLDITVEAQKVISCIVRTGQRYGMKMISDILLGSKTERIEELGFDRLSTYGIMKDTDEARLRQIIDIMLIEGILRQSEDEYRVLLLTTKAAEVIKNGRELKMELPRVKASYAGGGDSEEDNRGLFEELKKLRSKLAIRASLPAYAVFTDATLLDMCRKLPKTREEMLDVSGVGRAKLARFGNDFLKCIAEYTFVIPEAENRTSANAGKYTDSKRPWTEEEDDRLRLETRERMPVSVIARLHGRTTSSVIRRMKTLGITEE